MDSSPNRSPEQIFFRPLSEQADQSYTHSEPDVVRCAASEPERQRGNTARSQSEGQVDDDPYQRRLSYGDDPLWLGKMDQPNVEKLNFLLGRKTNMIRMTEVAPTHSSIREDDSPGWKVPIDTFTAKKQQGNIKQISKRLRSYYKAQEELITAYEDIAMDVEVDLHPTNVEANYRKAELFSKITLFINLLLLAAKAVASAMSGSIAIISSLVDSALDLFSGIIMLWATRAVKRRDPYAYPQGRTKLEPVAVIILAVFMALCSLQLIRESIEKIISLAGMDSSLPNIDAVTFAIAGSTIVVKLILWLVCRRVTSSSVILALAQDHRNDVLSNSVAIVCGYLGSKAFNQEVDLYGFAYVDPGGAIVISIYIMFNWWQTGREQIKMLTGHTARPDFLSKLTWVCVNHHKDIRHIDTVRAFHFGSNFLVEVDIVLSGEMVLREAHDIGESLQHRLESLPEVERAFVHLDYEFTHNPHSEHKIV